MRWNSHRLSDSTAARVAIVAGVVAATMDFGSSARADWRAYLLPASNGATDVAATGAGNGFFAGNQFIQGGSHATLWASPAAQPTSLHPGGRWRTSVVTGMWNSTQVGWAVGTDDQGKDITRAAVWTGTLASFRTLEPPSNTYQDNVAKAIRGQQVAGAAWSAQSALPRAVMWSGPTFSTFVDLHNNTRAEWSYGYATDGEYQGGIGVFRHTGYIHAALWHGSSASMTDVNPSWSRESWILGMAPGAQVGRAATWTAGYQPALWRGSADSAVIMTPSGFGGGELAATDGVRHVGLASIGSAGYAGIWMSDDPNSFVNLAALVGNNVVGSEANAIYSDASHIYVAGQIRLGDGPLQGVVWVQSIPEPCPAALIVTGALAAGRRRRYPIASSASPGSGARVISPSKTQNAPPAISHSRERSSVDHL